LASARLLLADRYGLKADTVRRYALRLKSHTFTGVRGRPPGSKDKSPRKRRPKQDAAKEEVVKDEATAGNPQDHGKEPLKEYGEPFMTTEGVERVLGSSGL